MKLLVDAGYYEFLTPLEDVKKQMLVMEKAGRTCWRTEKKGKIGLESAIQFLNKIVHQKHHESVIEHSIVTIKFFKVSRGFTHEKVRHRHEAVSQMSTRYVDPGDLECVAPPHKDMTNLYYVNGPKGKQGLTPTEMFELYEACYRALVNGDSDNNDAWVTNDARQFLPIATANEIVISASLRQWRHVFALRCDSPAHWEIRKIMCDLLVDLQAGVPVFFDDFYLAGHDKHGLRYFRKRQPLPEAVVEALSRAVNYFSNKVSEDPDDVRALEILAELEEIDAK